MSMKPGARTRPRASMAVSFDCGSNPPIRSMRSPTMRTFAARSAAPVPSATCALTMTVLRVDGCSSGTAQAAIVRHDATSAPQVRARLKVDLRDGRLIEIPLAGLLPGEGKSVEGVGMQREAGGLPGCLSEAQPQLRFRSKELATLRRLQLHARRASFEDEPTVTLHEKAASLRFVAYVKAFVCGETLGLPR